PRSPEVPDHGPFFGAADGELATVRRAKRHGPGTLAPWRSQQRQLLRGGGIGEDDLSVRARAGDVLVVGADGGPKGGAAVAGQGRQPFLDPRPVQALAHVPAPYLKRGRDTAGDDQLAVSAQGQPAGTCLGAVHGLDQRPGPRVPNSGGAV